MLGIDTWLREKPGIFQLAWVIVLVVVTILSIPLLPISFIPLGMLWISTYKALAAPAPDQQ